MPERLLLNGWQQFLLIMACPLIIGSIFFFWQLSRISRGTSKPRRKRKRKRF